MRENHRLYTNASEAIGIIKFLCLRIDPLGVKSGRFNEGDIFRSIICLIDIVGESFEVSIHTEEKFVQINQEWIPEVENATVASLMSHS